ncbi:MAG: biotin/lipoyl-containing protein, partial [Phycisphaerales bacterium JB064]
MAGKVSSDPNIFLLPDIGEGLQEAELIKWLVKEGDTVEEQQNLAEVETDKALTEIPSPRAGTIKTLHGKDGDTMKVGEPFVSFVGASGEAASPKPKADNGKAAPAAREDDGTVVGKMSAETPGLTRQEGKALATPAVRRKAREMGIDINAVPGSGIGGRVLEKDLNAFSASGGASAKPAASTPAKPAPSSAPTAGTTRKPMPRPQPQQQA